MVGEGPLIPNTKPEYGLSGGLEALGKAWYTAGCITQVEAPESRMAKNVFEPNETGIFGHCMISEWAVWDCCVAY